MSERRIGRRWSESAKFLQALGRIYFNKVEGVIIINYEHCVHTTETCTPMNFHMVSGFSRIFGRVLFVGSSDTH